jgi:Histidine kinase-, DNA gyrase B-, and HSP90-like ATPase
MMKRVVKNFLPNEDRVSGNVALANYKQFNCDAKLELFNKLPDAILILNHGCQIVYFNHSFLKYSSSRDPLDIIGLRPGEIFKCIHASENCCGGSEFCTQCGAARAIKDSLHSQNSSCECCITSTDGKVYNFRVWAHPHQVGNENYTLFIIRNIESEKSNLVLEQILFHDVINVASGVNGLLNMIGSSQENFDKYFWLLDMMSRDLVETIHSKQFLTQAEKGIFIPEMTKLNSNEIINEVVRFFEHHPLVDGKILTFKGSENIIFYSDRRLIKYIIRVMLQNALEASGFGKEILVNSKHDGSKVMFQVHNHGCIDSNVQLNIFKRSFSTKGTGHGWGAYGIKMLSEGYLNGRVWFSVNKRTGTTFFAEYPLRTG